MIRIPRTPLAATGVAALALLAACGSEPKKLNPTPDGVSYTYEDGDDLQKVTNKATGFCAERGKTAKLKTLGKSGDRTVAIFDCV